MRAPLALLLIVLVPTTVLAQEPVARPSYDTSNVMHVVGAILGVVGTGTAIAAGRVALDCSDPHSPCSAQPWSTIALMGGVLVIVSLVLGIAATELHLQTRRELRLQSTVAMPSLWIDAYGGGGGLSLLW